MSSTPEHHEIEPSRPAAQPKRSLAGAVDAVRSYLTPQEKIAKQAARAADVLLRKGEYKEAWVILEPVAKDLQPMRLIAFADQFRRHAMQVDPGAARTPMGREQLVTNANRARDLYLLAGDKRGLQRTAFELADKDIVGRATGKGAFDDEAGRIFNAANPPAPIPFPVPAENAPARRSGTG